MTNHPALQPVLAAGNVAMLTKYMEALTPPHADMVTDDYLDGYRAAVRAAVHLVNDMWNAAVIATDAVNLEMMQDVYPADDDEDLAHLVDALGKVLTDMPVASEALAAEQVEGLADDD